MNGNVCSFVKKYILPANKQGSELCFLVVMEMHVAGHNGSLSWYDITDLVMSNGIKKVYL